MTMQRNTAAGVRSTYGGQSRNRSFAESIAQRAGSVNRRAWQEQEAAQELQAATEKMGELRTALLCGLPAESGGIRYKQVTGIIYTLGPTGALRVSVELEDRNCKSYTVAKAMSVEVLELDTAEPPRYMYEPDPDVVAGLKAALRSGMPVIYEGVECGKLKSIIFRQDSKGGYRVAAGIEKPNPRRLVELDPVSLRIADEGTSAERCWLNMEDEL